MKAHHLGLGLLVAVAAAGCVSRRPDYEEPHRALIAPVPSSAVPARPAPKAATAVPQPTPPQPVPQQPKRQFQLGAAAAALVNEAREQAANNNPQLALSTIERALRIEPRNPLLWLMLGQAHQGAGQYGLAASMARKALELAQGDPNLQSRAWRLIGDSLRARGRNERANDAYARADELAAQ